MPPEQLLAPGKWQLKCLCLNLSENGPADSNSFTLLEWSYVWAQGLKRALFTGDRCYCVEEFFYFFFLPLWVFFNEFCCCVSFNSSSSIKVTEMLVCRRLHSSEGEAVGCKGVPGVAHQRLFLPHSPVACPLKVPRGRQYWGRLWGGLRLLKMAWAFKQQSMHPRKAGNVNRY